MDSAKTKRLERTGWVVGDSQQFLQLTEEENRFLELKLALASAVRELRERRGMTQTALADRLGSSQSRVAKMEAADRSVSLDLMIRALLIIGATATEIAMWIKRAETGMPCLSLESNTDNHLPSSRYTLYWTGIWPFSVSCSIKGTYLESKLA